MKTKAVEKRRKGVFRNREELENHLKELCRYEKNARSSSRDNVWIVENGNYHGTDVCVYDDHYIVRHTEHGNSWLDRGEYHTDYSYGNPPKYLTDNWHNVYYKIYPNNNTIYVDFGGLTLDGFIERDTYKASSVIEGKRGKWYLNNVAEKDLNKFINRLKKLLEKTK